MHMTPVPLSTRTGAAARVLGRNALATTSAPSSSGDGDAAPASDAASRTRSSSTTARATLSTASASRSPARVRHDREHTLDAGRPRLRRLDAHPPIIAGRDRSGTLGGWRRDDCA